MDRFAPAALLPELEPQKPVHFFLHTPLVHNILFCHENLTQNANVSRTNFHTLPIWYDSAKLAFSIAISRCVQKICHTILRFCRFAASDRNTDLQALLFCWFETSAAKRFVRLSRQIIFWNVLQFKAGSKCHANIYFFPKSLKQYNEK